MHRHRGEYTTLLIHKPRHPRQNLHPCNHEVVSSPFDVAALTWKPHGRLSRPYPSAAAMESMDGFEVWKVSESRAWLSNKDRWRRTRHCHFLASCVSQLEYYVSASSLVLSSGLCRTSSGVIFTPYLAVGGDFRGQAPNLVSSWYRHPYIPGSTYETPGPTPTRADTRKNTLLGYLYIAISLCKTKLDLNQSSFLLFNRRYIPGT